ncbi:hypothetical protein ACQQ2N_08115 [Dokdonella sp. MW10]|uniref:hypothetical protein n=1 Tax=Dokdonella sp. MW10 TaxID=2992926 RepID=UPI003F7FF817
MRSRQALAWALTVIVLCACGGGRDKAIEAQKDMYGFLAVPMPDGAPAGTILVFAPPNCPKESARRAQSLVDELSRRGVPVMLTSHYTNGSLMPGPESTEILKRLDHVMRGQLPIALVNGRGKANPSIEDVLATYRATTE